MPADPGPEYVRRHYRRLAPIGFALAFGPQLGNLAAQRFWPTARDPWGAIKFSAVLIALAMAALAVVLVLTVRWERRLSARIAEFAGKLCPHCAYPLPGRSGRTICPECGTACVMEVVERAWGGFRPRFGGLWSRWRGTA